MEHAAQSTASATYFFLSDLCAGDRTRVLTVRDRGSSTQQPEAARRWVYQNKTDSRVTLI